MSGMGRREFVALLGAAVTWPIAAPRSRQRCQWSTFSITRQPIPTRP